MPANVSISVYEELMVGVKRRARAEAVVTGTMVPMFQMTESCGLQMRRWLTLPYLSITALVSLLPFYVSSNYHDYLVACTKDRDVIVPQNQWERCHKVLGLLCVDFSPRDHLSDMLRPRTGLDFEDLHRHEIH